MAQSSTLQLHLHISYEDGASGLGLQNNFLVIPNNINLVSKYKSILSPQPNFMFSFYQSNDLIWKYMHDMIEIFIKIRYKIISWKIVILNEAVWRFSEEISEFYLVNETSNLLG